MDFYVGLHQPSDARHFERAFISVNRLRRRKFMAEAARWVMDSGAFTEISTHGRYRSTVDEYACEIRRWSSRRMVAAVSQDYMCEPHILRKTGMTVRQHQRLTISRYRALTRLVNSAYIMPVLQGYEPHEYARHVEMYGSALERGAWTGVGSICKRNIYVDEIAAVLRAVKSTRPDLRLHGFGLKVTALMSSEVRSMLHSADSMAWSFAARYEGRNQNDWREAARLVRRIERLG